MTRTDGLEDLAESDPRRAIDEGTALLERTGSPEQRAEALQAIGRAKLTLGDAPGSVEALEAACLAAEDGGDELWPEHLCNLTLSSYAGASPAEGGLLGP